MSGDDDSAPQRVDLDVAAIAEFLSKNLPSTEVRRIDGSTGRAFTAKKFVQFVVDSTHACLKDVKTEDDAHVLGGMLASSTDPLYLSPANLQHNKARNVLVAVPTRPHLWSRKPLSVYVWEFRGSQTRQHVILAAIIAVIFIGCLFPVWPRWGKLGALAVSAGLLVLLLGSILFRAILGYFTWMLGYEVWILPNVFDEAESFSALLHPYISWGPPPRSHRWYRLAMLGVVLACSYWVYTQPDEFDKFLTAQKEFVTGLYEGAFVADKTEAERLFEEGGEAPRGRNKRETVEDLFDDLLGKRQKQQPRGADAQQEDDTDPFDFEAGLDDIIDGE